jgi:glycosyltransferase involved in cell wall biosynthesis
MVVPCVVHILEASSGQTAGSAGRMMRVIHIVPALFSPKGGIIGGGERYALELARHMAEQVPTTLVTFADQPRREDLGKLPVHVCRSAWYVRGQRSNPYGISFLPELRNADVVHCHQQHTLVSSTTALLCRLSNRRVFVTDLGGGGWDLSGYVSTDRWYNGHLHISEYSRRIAGHADRPWAHVIMGGIDINKFAPRGSIIRNGTVLYVGRILPHKGIDDLVKAIPNTMRLEIIGMALDANYLQDLKTLARGKPVVFRHNCDDTELIEAYRRALCVVLPSVYRTMYGDSTLIPELLGQTLLEAMACEAPVICTNVASLPEVVEDGMTGFVVPPNDPASMSEKIKWICGHPEKAMLMGKAGRLRVLKKFTWRQVVQRCLEIYTS